MDIVPANETQLNLFVKFDHTRNQSLMTAIDGINARWGNETVRSGASGYERPWGMKRAILSPRYTTNWNQVIKAQS